MIGKISGILVSAALLYTASAFASGGGEMGGGGMGGGEVGGMSGAEAPSAAELDAAYNQGVGYVKAEDWKNAIKKFSYVSQYLPKLADNWNYLGYAQRKGGNPKKSEVAYKKALKIDPNHPRANEYYGELLLETNRLPEAEQRLAVLKACCASDPGTATLAGLIEKAKAAPAAAATPSTGY